MMDKLKPCPCGNPVEVKYVAGIGKGILEFTKNPFASGVPSYYIHCEKCGKAMEVKIRMVTVAHRNKCKRSLIKRWNTRTQTERGGEK